MAVVCKALVRRQWRSIAVLPGLRVPVSWQMRWRSGGANWSKRSKSCSGLCVECLQSELVTELAGQEEVVASLKRQLTEAQAHAEVSAAFAV